MNEPIIKTETLVSDYSDRDYIQTAFGLDPENFYPAVPMSISRDIILEIAKIITKIKSTRMNEPIIKWDGPCLSTHGMGYAPGSYWDGDAIICGWCLFRIENPPSTGAYWVDRKGFWNKLLNRGDWVPKWPDWIGQPPGVVTI